LKCKHPFTYSLLSLTMSSSPPHRSKTGVHKKAYCTYLLHPMPPRIMVVLNGYIAPSSIKPSQCCLPTACLPISGMNSVPPPPTSPISQAHLQTMVRLLFNYGTTKHRPFHTFIKLGVTHSHSSPLIILRYTTAQFYAPSLGIHLTQRHIAFMTDPLIISLTLSVMPYVLRVAAQAADALAVGMS
jgi:hypothetical protein